MFRKAGKEDIEQIVKLYDQVHTENEAGRMTTQWVRGIYPTRETAEASVRQGDMFVEEEMAETGEKQIVAAARINQEQLPDYDHAAWEYDAPEDQVMVLHTLVVSPAEKGKGYGSAFVSFYETYAREHGCRFLRMDTSVKNLAARALYKKLGYKEVSVISCIFNEIRQMDLVCLEKRL
ncbi:MAG TPA: GNAT family N-acetyltransferase [Lachnospiraceae bacterium]|nr:GNAT family N-acetyltransferase [Lachnospiraceae bacterium]